MKLLYITNQVCGSGGLERVLSIKASYLADRLGYKVHFATLNQGNQSLFFEFSNQIQQHDVVVTGNPLKYLKSYVFGLKKVVKEIKPDVIIVCDDGLKGFFLPTILQRKCPIIYERHVSKKIFLNENDSVFQLLKSKVTFCLMNILVKTFDKFVVLTNDNVTEWKVNNIDVIPNPLPFYPEKTADFQNKTVIAVGKQSYQKGYDLLLQSWQLVHQQNPDWTLKIYGKKDLNQGFENLAKKLNIDKSVQFLEPDKNIEERFLEASIFVLSSRFEGFGMVLIEAMACGLPVISFDCPCGPIDIIADQEDGFLIENGNVNQFASAINSLIENKNLRIKMGEIARQNVQRFLPENVVLQWDKLFKNLTQ